MMGRDNLAERKRSFKFQVSANLKLETIVVRKILGRSTNPGLQAGVNDLGKIATAAAITSACTLSSGGLHHHYP